MRRDRIDRISTCLMFAAVALLGIALCGYVALVMSLDESNGRLVFKPLP
jgi:hypothetical protein